MVVSLLGLQAVGGVGCCACPGPPAKGRRVLNVWDRGGGIMIGAHLLAERMVNQVPGVIMCISSKVTGDDGGRAEFLSIMPIVGVFTSSNGA